MAPGLQRAALAVGLGAAVLAVYFGVWDHAFLSYDDALYVTDNPRLAAGLSAEGVRWAFTTDFGANWFPLTWLSLLLDHELHGLDPAGFHVTNLLLHAATSMLLFAVMVGMTGATGRSAFVAGVFALHPLHVESVAWVAERKDVLSGLFWVLAMGAWARYAARPSTARYAVVFVALGLGLMAKPMLVTLPFVLLLLDDWPLGRLRDAEGRVSGDRLLQRFVEKLPLLGLAAASSVVTLIVQRAGGAMRTLERIPFDERLANALVAYARYLGKAFLPSGLAVYYPHPLGSLPAWQPVAAGALLLGVSLLACLRWRRWPWLFTGWFWFLGTLIPVIGLVQVGGQAMADRYTYLPLIGLSIPVAWGGSALLARFAPRPARLACAVALLVALGVVAARQVGHWRDDLSLFGHALAVTRDNDVAHTALAFALLEKERGDEAAAHLEEALRIAPGSAVAHGLLGDARAAQGRMPEAEAAYRRALALDSRMPRTSIGLGNALLAQGRVEEAAEAYREAVAQRPDLAPAHANLALALARLGRPEEAEARYREALELDPGAADVRARLALLLAGEDRNEEAVAELERASRAVPLETRYPALRATLLFRLGRHEEAIADYRETLRRGGGGVQVDGNLAFLLATRAEPEPGDAQEAVRLAERAAAASERRRAEVLDTLSLSYAAAGRPRAAEETAREALALAEAEGDAELARRIRARLGERAGPASSADPASADPASGAARP